MSDSKNAGHDHDHDAIGHVTPPGLLLLVGGTLLFLTAVTVWVTMADLGRTGNLIVAMVIATIKATMVCTYFMHLKWDKPFNAVVFASSILFVSLFITIALLDKSDYEGDIQEMNLLEGK
ncbi:MAG TPA: cytochrome C oxidase subunit IV family protein [Polyangiaceae bacterium]|jgi:cytochrome c oxidase subunit 4|nr:cytochrome C oxidase subunit IV family protein [Polyangiaceae bacterium]